MSQRIKITDFMAPELDVYARLTENQLLNRAHPEEGIFIAESPKVIERALDAGCIPVSLLMETKHVQGEAKEMIERCGDIPVYTAEFDVLTKLQEPEEICAKARRIAVLENVVNPTNVGAIFRSAAALHMDAVLLTQGCSDPLYRRAIRVSMGTVFQIPWTYLQTENGVKNPPGQAAGADIDHLHRMGFRVAAMALSGDSVGIDDPALAAEEKLAVVLGTEGDGLAGHTIADCDYTVCIPMSHGVDSLNVAAASAVAFWQLGRNNCTIKH